MPHTKLLILALLSSMAGHTSAACSANWLDLPTTEIGRTVCFDLSTENIGQGLRLGKVLSHWKNTQTIDDGTIKFRSVRQLIILDCSRNKTAIKSMAFFANAGGDEPQLREIKFSPDGLDWTDDFPAAMHSRVCN